MFLLFSTRNMGHIGPLIIMRSVHRNTWLSKKVNQLTINESMICTRSKKTECYLWMDRCSPLGQTYIGSVLVSVNPYKELEIYTKNHMERYRGVNFYEVSPHMWVHTSFSTCFSLIGKISRVQQSFFSSPCLSSLLFKQRATICWMHLNSKGCPGKLRSVA